jgi:hypothetical protein
MPFPVNQANRPFFVGTGSKRKWVTVDIWRDGYRERARPFASCFGLRGADALGMKTLVGSLNRVLNFRTRSKVRFVVHMNIETALSIDETHAPNDES